MPVLTYRMKQEKHVILTRHLYTPYSSEEPCTKNRESPSVLLCDI